MTATKTFVTAGTLGTALLFGGIVLYLNLSSIAKGVTEKIATETLGVPVHIAAMDVDLPKKSVKVSGVRVGNPDGFGSKYATKIGAVTIALGALESGKPITFNTIDVSGLEMNVEVTPGGINLNKIRENAAANKKKPAADAEPKKVIIKTLSIGETKLHPIVEISGQDIDTITMPPIKLRGIGERQNGVLAQEAIAQIWDQVSGKAVQAATKQGVLDNIKGEIGKQVDGIKNLFGD